MLELPLEINTDNAVQDLHEDDPLPESERFIDYIISIDERFDSVDDDLNRSFSLGSLNGINTSGYEQKRAKEVSSLIGPKKKTRNNSTFIF